MRPHLLSILNFNCTFKRDSKTATAVRFRKSSDNNSKATGWDNRVPFSMDPKVWSLTQFHSKSVVITLSIVFGVIRKPVGFAIYWQISLNMKIGSFKLITSSILFFWLFTIKDQGNTWFFVPNTQSRFGVSYSPSATHPTVSLFQKQRTRQG